MKKCKLILIGNSQVSTGMDGCTRIFIECAKRWIGSKVAIDIITNKIGYEIYYPHLREVNYHILPPIKKYNLLITYFLRTIIGCRIARKLRLEKNVVVYSGSDFWPDSLPAFLLKLRYKDKILWIAGFYLFAPKPWQKNSPYRKSFKSWLIGVMYWLTQLPVYWIIKKYADYVFVTSVPDVKKFVTKKRNKNKVIVIRGGVNVKEVREYLENSKVVPIEKRKYDAVFVGRFHYQKGVVELIEIWKLVCAKKSNAKLAMIGIGPLESKVKERIKKLKLENNIDLLGFKDGKDKYEIFKQSKIVVHPATYDSGGMAACEAMAWGLPGVSFDLESLRTYYPKGMLKTPCYDLKKFAENILLLLEDKKLYDKVSKEARDWAEEWDWDKRAEEIFNSIFGKR